MGAKLRQEIEKLYRDYAEVSAGSRSMFDPTIIERRDVFLRYILARIKGVTLAEDPIAMKLGSLGEYLGVRGEIRKAKQDLWAEFPPELAEAVERLITGEPWTEDADRSSAGIHGSE